MKTGLKSFVRAISPFTKAKSTEGLPPSKASANEFFWDLSKVDMVAMLSNFYTTYNPERVRSVHEILHQYEGEEVLMLQQLCERYNLSELDIQRFLDSAILGRRDNDKFGNWMKKKSEGSVTFTDPGSKDASITGSATGTKETLQDTRPRSGYSGFVWDLSAVDLPKALKLLYRKHNPQKTPNVASLDNKTENEKILLLQQLCKRHNLTQADMQFFLDKAHNKDEENLHSKTKSGWKSRSAGTASASASDDGDSQSHRTNSLRKSVAGSDVAASLLSSFQKQPYRQSSIADRQDEETSVDVPSNKSEERVITGGLQRQGSLPFWQNAFSLSTTATSPPPPPPPPPLVFNSSPGRPPTSVTATAATRQSTSPGSVAESVTSSVTAGSRFDVVDDPVRSRSGSNRFSPSPSPSVASLSRANSVANKNKEDQSVSESHRRGFNSEYNNTHQEEGLAETVVVPTRTTGVSRSNSRAGNSVADNSSATAAAIRSAEAARAAELLDLQRELSEARLQIAGAKKENLALAKALQSSKQRHTDAESIVSELSSHQAHLDQVPEMLSEISKLKNALQLQEERESALLRQYNQLKQQVQELQEQVISTEKQCEDARGDAKDVLRLIDIMSASPAGIKSVLEAYLKQLGEATGSVPVKFGIGTDGRQIPISERIALALQIKREQLSSAKDKVLEGANREVAVSSARSTPVKSREGSNSRALERQQENYQKFKSTIALQQKQKSDKTNSRSEETFLNSRNLEGEKENGLYDEAADAAGKPEEPDEERDFSDYASPAAASSTAARKSSSRIKKSSEGVVQGEQAQASATNSDGASDWIECLDPRSKRKYYYSAILKKSTWTKPAGYSSSGHSRSATGTPALASMGVTMPSRYNSPNVSMHMAGRQPQQQPQVQNDVSIAAQRMTADELRTSDSVGTSMLSTQAEHSGHASSLRSASPYGANNSMSSAQVDYANVFSVSSKIDQRDSRVVQQSNFRSGSNGSRASSPAPSTLRSGSPTVRTLSHPSPVRNGTDQDWVTAVDPNSNRKYWYNRKTKVSTWRQPAELII